MWMNKPEKIVILFVYLQGAKKDGKAPDGTSYMDCAETDDIKVLLRT